MKIAFTGIRGIPANYSGFETFAEISARALVLSGHKVYIYNRTHHYKKNRHQNYKGAEIIWLTALPFKHFDTFFHTLFSLVHASFCDYDVVYICGVGNALLSFIPRMFGKKVFLNVDGLDWKREKWNRAASLFLKFSERIALYFPTFTITDSLSVSDYYQKTYGKKPSYVPYFTLETKTTDTEILKEFNLEKDKYILCVGRLVPENNVHLLIKAYKKLKTDIKLVIVGDAPYVDDYIKNLHQEKCENIIFTGYLFKKPYRELSSNCLYFCLPGHAGGMRVVLLEQMSFGNAILANSSKNNIEALDDTALFSDFNDTEETTKNMQKLIDDKQLVKTLQKATKKRERRRFRLKHIFRLYAEILGKEYLK